MELRNDFFFFMIAFNATKYWTSRRTLWTNQINDGDDLRHRVRGDRDGLFKLLCLVRQNPGGRSFHGSGTRPHHWIRSWTSLWNKSECGKIKLGIFATGKLAPYLQRIWQLREHVRFGNSRMLRDEWEATGFQCASVESISNAEQAQCRVFVYLRFQSSLTDVLRAFGGIRHWVTLSRIGLYQANNYLKCIHRKAVGQQH